MQDLDCATLDPEHSELSAGAQADHDEQHAPPVIVPLTFRTSESPLLHDLDWVTFIPLHVVLGSGAQSPQIVQGVGGGVTGGGVTGGGVTGGVGTPQRPVVLVPVGQTLEQ